MTQSAQHATHDRTNRLVDETSPYLLQHAYNPVDWHPWGPEALELARTEDKPIFLSIGYSACHWCHVMERESFENQAIADLMNQHFVNIKVDREERPDLDQIYMNAVVSMTGQGGWPMSVWLTPDLKPFFGGTYFPPTPMYNRPSFPQLILGVADAWRNRRGEIEETTARLVERLHEMARVENTGAAVDENALAKAAVQLERLFDRRFGGIGRAPKFPHSVEFRVMLRAAAKLKNIDYRDLVVHSLDCMIRGGIYDQLGGGFHRYSTDGQWLAPHFEKMLYDNSLVTLACLEGFQASGDPTLRRAAVETLDYVRREMTAPDGSFYSTQDADSEGEEGKFFVWSRAEVLRILEPALGAEDAKRFCYAYDVTDEGNWEHKTILRLPKKIEAAASMTGASVQALEAALARGRKLLFAEREKRVKPGRDEKIVTAWNGMMIDAMAVGAQVLNEPTYAVAAARAADAVLAVLRTPDGRLLRTAKDGRAHLNAYLEDYAFLANGLVSLYEASGDPRWIAEAEALTATMVAEFWDDADGGFFFTGKSHESLLVRGKDPH
ncbi:MAG: thioredoxin domain-containing protein, partial [Planctomycetia bacterium]